MSIFEHDHESREAVPDRPVPSWDMWPNRILTDGRLIAIEPLITGTARFHVVPNAWAHASSDLYDYPSFPQAVAAMFAWDGTGDPADGWLRHKPSNRRRVDGDPTREEVRP